VPRKGAPAVRRVGRILLHALVVSVTVTLIAFTLVRLTPGDPAVLLLGEQATPESLAALREQLGLSGSILEQLRNYGLGLVTGNLGTSIAYGAPVTDLILRGLPITLGLMAFTTVLAVLFTVPIAVWGALRPRGWFSRVFTMTSAVLVSTPSFFLGLLALLVLALWLKVAPISGIGDGFIGALQHLWLPSLVICASLVPVMARVLRSSIMSTMREEFVEVAIVRGVDQRRFISRYLLRPSIAPSINLLSYIVASMFAATVVIELVFNLPGIGQLLVNAVNARDYPIVQGVTLVSGLIVVIITTIGDIITAVVDPRTASE
jgi:peptide/nickel transport system permease protein